MLRISLGLAIAALVVVCAVAWLGIRPRIQDLNKERDALKVLSEQNRVRANKAETFARELTARLADAESRPAASKAAADRTTHLKRELEEARNQLDSAKQEIARWNATGTAPDQVASLARQNKALGVELSELKSKNDRLSRDLATAKRTLLLAGIEPVQELPPMRGSVLVVDPKWDFVVVNLGETNGLLRDSVLMISREGKLIGKVKARHVGPDRTVADIIPGWRLAEIHEGDQVMN